MSPQTDDRISRLIEEIVQDARPVRRLWPPAIRLSAWFVILLATTSVVVVAGLRPGVVQRLESAAFLGELVCLSAATGAAAWIALRAAIPGLESGFRRSLLVGSTVGGLGFVLSLVQTRFAAGIPLTDFVRTGIHCTLASIVIAVVPAWTLVWAVGRGVAYRPAWAGATGGLAASIWTYVLMQLRCRLDETAHVIVWHGGPLVAVTAASAALAVVIARARHARGTTL